MRVANPRAHVERLIGNSNYVAAHLFIREAELEREEYIELVGMVAGSVADELSRTRRDDRERLCFLRSTLAWILRDVPGLGSLYREQLREARGGGGGIVESVARGIRNAGDIAAGRKSVSEGLEDVADDVRQNVGTAADAVSSGEAASLFNEFLANAETGVRDGLDQLGEFFRSLNERSAANESTNAAAYEEEEGGPGVGGADTGDASVGSEEPIDAEPGSDAAGEEAENGAGGSGAAGDHAPDPDDPSKGKDR